MKHIKLAMLALAAACAFSGAMASTSQAVVCTQVAQPGSGNWRESLCRLTGFSNEYIRVERFLLFEPGGIYCAKTWEPNTGNWTDNECRTKGTGNFIRVYARQFWQRGGFPLPENVAPPIKLQLKGTAKLKVPSVPFTIECAGSMSEGAAIEGQAKTHQGQDKGRITYKGCKTSAGEGCTVAEPLTTAQTKSYLAITEDHTNVARPVDVFEPAKGKVLAEVTLKGAGCGVLAGKQSMNGSVAAEVKPEEAETKEGLLFFPGETIKSVKTEAGEKTVGLTLGGLESVLGAGYGAELESGEAFGVGG
jgi:hypothetical protein